MKTTDEFDRVLSDALSEYRQVEPLAGLEDRVLRRLQQQSGRRQRWWRWGFAAGLTTALLAVAAWIELHHLPFRPQIERTIVGRVAPLPSGDRSLAGVANPKPDHMETAPGEVLARSQQKRTPLKAANTVARRPMQNRFPVPAPLTPEERALMALVRTNPEALQTLSRNTGNLAIVPITIQSLADDGGDEQGDN